MFKLKISSLAFWALEAGVVLALAFGLATLAQAENWTLQGSNIYNNNAGSVGVGTSSPAALLFVQASSASTTPLFTVSSSTGSSFFTVNSSGQVLIGTSTPLSASNILQAFSASTNARVQFASATTTGSAVIILGGYLNSNNFGRVRVNESAAVNTSLVSLPSSLEIDSGTSATNGIDIVAQNGPIIFATGGVSTSTNERIVITNSGNVGINTSTPSQALDVNGSIHLTGNIVSDGDICIGTCP